MNAIESNIALLEQGLEFLRRVAPAAYREPAPGKSSVGAQYRHVLDHYRAVLDGVGHGRIDFDHRRRDAGVETDREVAAADTRTLMARLVELSNVSGDTPLAVSAACSASAPGTPQPSSLGRELHFLVSHTVHHYAIIKLLLDHDDAVPADFGIAPSTLAWQQSGSH